MPMIFQSFRSGSSGNALLLATAATRLLIEFGIRTKRDSRQVVETIAAGDGPVTAALISHLHADHASPYGLATLAEAGIPVYLPAKARLDASLPAELNPRWYDRPPLAIGDITILPWPVRHAPGVPTYGFIAKTHSGQRERTAGIFTDLRCWDEALLQQLTRCDFIYLECNHDRQLLREHPNYASRYHLANPNTALFVRALLQRGARPGAIMLGHLSEERNRPELARAAVEAELCRVKEAGRPALYIAPRHEPSPRISIEAHAQGAFTGGAAATSGERHYKHSLSDPS